MNLFSFAKYNLKGEVKKSLSGPTDKNLVIMNL